MKKILSIFAISVILPQTVSMAQQREIRESFVEQMNPRDSILIADQLKFGADLKNVPDGTVLEFPEVGDTLCAGVDLLQAWTIDTLKVHRRAGTKDLRASVTVTSFDEGEYVLPGFQVAVHNPDGSVDTLLFEGQDVFFCTVPVDTSDFKIREMKEQMRYPVTFTEVLPWIGGALLLAAIVAVLVWYLRRRKRLKEEEARKDPPHIVALRKLDAFRGDKYWAAPKQKAFYSGVTDALREYMCARYGIAAMEMTTAEIFNALKKSDLPVELSGDLKKLFELSDYVKFAKHLASDEENAGVLPLSVRFVTSTYEEDIQEDVKENRKEGQNVL